ncbi:MAG: hypothetical protein AAGE84_03825 [Cyanobacteria bacterium P01_G01_bin.39]
MKTLCPICSDILLRHLYRGRIAWFCLGCHQEMPNFNLIKLNSIQKKNRVSSKQLSNYENSSLESEINNIYQAIQYQSTTINLFVNQNKTRLEVISFILNKIELLLVNTCFERQQSKVESQSSLIQLKYQKFKPSTFTKIKFLRDSEIILLHICQAILVADRSILNKAIKQESKNPYVALKLQIEKTYFIDLMKTLVIDFIKSIALSSSQNIDSFASEISGYFETVISLMISPGSETDATQN